MSKIGAHVFIWTSGSLDEKLKSFSRAKEIGFDGVEVPIEDTSIGFEQVKRARKELERVGLECTCGTGLGKSENLIDEDKAVRERGKQHLKRAIGICSDLGSHILSGVLYGAFQMSKGRGRTQEEWDLAVTLLREAAEFAEDKGVTLCIESVNRYETYFLNTAADTLRLARNIGRDNVKVHFDTYHMNIEEKEFYAPIVNSRGYLGHVHISENDRGIPGTGHLNWDQVFRALSEIDYKGWLVIEGFYGYIKELAIAASIWRKLAKDPEDFAVQGLKFVREKAKKYGL